MFKHIGHKIQELSKILCWINITVCVIVGVFIMFRTLRSASSIDAVKTGIEQTLTQLQPAEIVSSESNESNIGFGIATGSAIILLGSLLSWVGSWLLYAFGQLVEDVHRIAHHEDNAAQSDI